MNWEKGLRNLFPSIQEERERKKDKRFEIGENLKSSSFKIKED